MSDEGQINKPVVQNDNFFRSWIGKGDTSLDDQLIPHIPMANWLIEKFCNSPWKNYPGSGDYQAAQHSLCLHLYKPLYPREWMLRFLAIHLECNPIIIMNDKSPELDTIPYPVYDIPEA